MTVIEKTKTINDKIEQSKAQYNLDRQRTRISTLSPGNVGKYELLIGEDVIPEKRTVRKHCYSHEYSTLGKELKKQIGTVGKQYQMFDNIFGSNNDNKNVKE